MRIAPTLCFIEVTKKVATSEANTGARDFPDQRQQRIEEMLERVKRARDDAQFMELKFEAYLLEMATMALKEQLLRPPPQSA